MDLAQYSDVIVIVSFVISGLFLGGSWTLYQSKKTVGTTICLAIAVMALVNAVVWYMSI